MHERPPAPRSWWEGVCICVPTRDMPSRASFDSCMRLVRLGARYIDQPGMSSVCTARNMLLTRALDLYAQCDTLLLVDDDIGFAVEQAQELVERTRLTQHPHSGRYIAQDGRLCAKRVTPTRWWTGLGFFAVPRDLLLAVAPERVRFIRELAIYPFCTESPQEGEWVQEDHSLCRLLGGVILTDIRVRHWKVNPLLAPEVGADEE